MNSHEFQATMVQHVQAAFKTGKRRVLMNIPMGAGTHRILQTLLSQHDGRVLCVFPKHGALTAAGLNGLVKPQAVAGLPGVFPLAEPAHGLATSRRVLKPEALGAIAVDMDLLVLPNVGLEESSVVDTLPLVEHIGAPRVLWTTYVSSVRFAPFMAQIGIDAVVDGVTHDTGRIHRASDIDF